MSDIKTIDTELMLADMQSLEGMIDKAQKNIRLGGPEAKRRLEILTDCQSRLNEGKPVRSLSYEDPTSAKILSELQFITSKRVLYVANVGEEDLTGTNPRVEKVKQHAAAEGSEVVKVVARLERERDRRRAQ